MVVLVLLDDKSRLALGFCGCLQVVADKFV
jgi:hypothetical protein